MDEVVDRPDQFDLICLGSGIGGLSAAIAGCDAGLRVLVIEKSPMLGGVSAYSAGTVWVPVNHLMAAEGIEDTPEEASEYLKFIGGAEGPVDLDLRAMILAEAPSVLEGLAREIPFSISGSPDQYWDWGPGSKPKGRVLETYFNGGLLGPWRGALRPNPYFPSGLMGREIRELRVPPTVARERLADLVEERRAADQLTNGSGLMAGFIWSALVRRGVPCLTGTAAEELVVTPENGVEGVVINEGGRRRRLQATAGVVIATGSYGYAPYAAAMEGLPIYREQSPPIVHGDGLALASQAGAAVVRAGNGFYSVGIPSTTRFHPGSDEPLYLSVVLAMSYPHSIVVNAAGDRFADESVFGAFSAELMAFDGRMKRHRNLPCFFVCDDRFRQAGYRINGANEGWPTAELVRGDSLVELANSLGVHPGGLSATVARFNEFEVTGEDLEFGRGTSEFTRRPQMGSASNLVNPLIGSLLTPPFWGARLDPVGTGICSHGLKVDGAGRVLDWSSLPIRGLYATSNAVAYTELPFGYQDGYANTRNIVLGNQAARNAAQRKVLLDRVL